MLLAMIVIATGCVLLFLIPVPCGVHLFSLSQVNTYHISTLSVGQRSAATNAWLVDDHNSSRADQALSFGLHSRRSSGSSSNTGDSTGASSGTSDPADGTDCWSVQNAAMKDPWSQNVMRS